MITLTRLKIKQFRSYEDIEIFFLYENGVILVSGDNGSGKSNLLNAICWCLYADTPFFAVGDSPEIINMHAPSGSTIEVEVEVKINESTYIFKRTGTKESRGGVQLVSSETNGNWQSLDSSSAQDAVKKLLPKDIRHLFIFNGEQISSIFRPNNDIGLKTSVQKVSEINVLDNTKRHLAEVQEVYLREIEKGNKNSKHIEVLKQQSLLLFSDIDKNEISVKQLDTRINGYKEKLVDLNEIIKTTASARQMLETLKVLQDNLGDTIDTLSELEADKTELFHNNYHRALLSDDFSAYVKVLETAQDQDLIPPPIKPEVTSRILKTKMCICGREIGDSETNFIQQQHLENVAKAELNYLTEGIYVNETVAHQLESAKYAMKDADRQYQLKMQEKRTMQEKVREINDLLDDANLQHDNPEVRRNEIQHDIDMAISAKASLNASIDRDKRTYRENEDLLKKTIAKDSATYALEQKRLLTLKLIDYISDMKDEMEDAIREKMQRSVSEIFFSVMPNTVFTEIEIDENYGVSLISNDGVRYLTNQLSTGQAKVLGLSLAYSLSKDVGYESSPILIDNLYGDIKDTRFKELTKMIEVLAEKKQVLIMDLNAEKSRGMFSEGSIAQEFHIKRIESERKTIIEEVKN